VNLTIDTSADVLTVLAELLAALEKSDSAIILLAPDLLISPLVLSPVTENSIAGTCAAVRPDREANLRLAHHEISAVATSFHQINVGNAKSVGAIRINPRDFPATQTAINELREVIVSGDLIPTQFEVTELVLAALTRGQVNVRAVELIDAPWFRSATDRNAAQKQIDAMPEARIRALQANRVDDGFYSTFVVRSCRTAECSGNQTSAFTKSGHGDFIYCRLGGRIEFCPRVSLGADSGGTSPATVLDFGLR